MSDVEMAAADTASPAEAVVGAPAQDTPAVSEAPERDLDAELSAQYDRIHQPRDESGKFKSTKAEDDAPVEGAAPEAEQDTEGQSPETEAVEPAKPAINAPVSWPAEMKAKFGTLPPDVQEYVLKRESESHSAITRMGQQVAAYKPVAELLEQNKARFDKAGLDYADGIGRLLNVETMLERDPYSAIQQIANAYGVDLGLYGGERSGSESNAEIASLKRQVEYLTSQLNETSTRVMTREQREAMAEQQALEAQIADFVKDKPDFDTLENEMLIAIPAIRQQKPGLSPKEILAEAYEQAKWLNPAVRERVLAEQRKAEADRQAAEAKKRATEAKKAASVNVRQSPPTSGKPMSWDDDLSAAYDRIQARA